MVGFSHLERGVRCRAAEGSSVGEHPGAAVISVGKVVFQSRLKFYYVQRKISVSQCGVIFVERKLQIFCIWGGWRLLVSLYYRCYEGIVSIVSILMKVL